MADPSTHRREYYVGGLSEGDLADDPITQFRRWFDDAVAAGTSEPNAMALATATPEGRPSVRMILLKGLDERGFAFFTNDASQKGSELVANPHAALVFRWDAAERQVRVTGSVERVPEAEADAYFATRPRGAQLGAWASRQSAVLPDRSALEARYAEAEERYAGADVPRPPFWGGWLVVPEAVEFWQGRLDRLHDRLRYRRTGDTWTVERLAP